MNRVLMVPVLVALTLTGCEPPEPTKEQREAAHIAKCEGFGFKPKTDAFANCLMQQDKLYHEDRNQYLMRVGQSLNRIQSTSCSTVGSSTICNSY